MEDNEDNKENKEKLGENKIISDVFYMKEIFNVLNAVVDECRIHILEDGWKISTNTTNATSVELDIPDENFKDYNIKNPFIVELDTSEVLNIFEDKEGYKPVGISLESIYEDNKEMYKIKFRIDDIVHNFISSKFKERAKRTVPISIKDNIEVSIGLRHLREIIKACSYVDDFVTFESKDGKLRIYAEDIYRSVEIFIEKNIIGSELNKAKSMFSLEYIRDVIKNINESTNSIITLYLGVDCPLTIKFNVCRCGEGIYVIAPRTFSENDQK